MQLFAQPWWVNLLLVVPFLLLYWWRSAPLSIAPAQLAWAAVFSAGFGFVEAAVVVYLRAALGLLPGYQGTLADVVRLSRGLYERGLAGAEVALPQALVTVETCREAATIVMLVAVAALATHAAHPRVARWRERCAMFLWCFAIWDAAYYAALWATVRWPDSLRATDVLFLIPVPWYAQVWFPLFIDLAVLAAILLRCRGAGGKASATERAQAA